MSLAIRRIGSKSGIRLLVGLVVLDLAVIAWSLVSFRNGISADVYRVDLDVYRLGTGVWWRGGDLYGQLPELQGGGHLPFIYPPIAAVALAPFALVPYGLASAAMAILTIAALALVLVLVLRSLDVRPSALVICALLPAALVLEPVRSTLYYGQVNVLLMALVAVDCLARTPRWPRGALVGLAAAIKLTPAAFVLFFLLRGDRRAALTAGASFLCATGLGFLLAPGNSVRFWTAAIFDIDQRVNVWSTSNQSIAALLVRLGIDAGVLRLLLAGAVLALAAPAMRRAFAAGRPTWALALNALGALVVPPISWSHHWVWVVPILLTAGVLAWRARSWPALAAMAGGTLLVFLSPHWWWHKADPWTVGRLLFGDTYLFAAVAVLAVAARLANLRSGPRASRLAGRERVVAEDDGGGHGLQRYVGDIVGDGGDEHEDPQGRGRPGAKGRTAADRAPGLGARDPGQERDGGDHEGGGQHEGAAGDRPARGGGVGEEVGEDRAAAEGAGERQGELDGDPPEPGVAPRGEAGQHQSGVDGHEGEVGQHVVVEVGGNGEDVALRGRVRDAQAVVDHQQHGRRGG
jgi:alpha-1,2-mannosyltransferase